VRTQGEATAAGALDYRPSFPQERFPIAIIGCGAAAKDLHLPAYAKWGVEVAGVYDPVPAATEGVRERFPFVATVYRSLEELLDDEAVIAVDIATRPAERPELILRAFDAGKHVLAQKPLALDVESAQRLVEAAGRAGLMFAVNQNGRWAPPWRAATLLVEQGAIGEVFAVTHLHDKPMPALVGTHFDELEHFVLYDYDVHWIDISRCWLASDTPVEVRASEHRTPDQPPHTRNAWAATVEIRYASGANVLIRTVGEARTARPGAPFWIHGTEGTIRGSVLLGSEFLELDRDGELTRLELTGSWYPDGFAGTLAELQRAVAENREPYNSARHNLLSLELTLAACRSAELDGAAVSV
jgi:predicted dehydrogenase